MRRLCPASLAMCLALAGLFVASPLLSHDFWLIPNAFHVTPGGELVVLGQTSSEFPQTVSAVTVDRVESASVLTASTELDINDLDVSGSSLRLRQRMDQAGQAIVQVAVQPRDVPESAESFRRYLTLEGAPEALERYERQGILPVDSVTRRYAKYAKAIVEVGHAGPRAYDRIVEHPLEFVPLFDPSASAEGQDLHFRILFRGQPIAQARGHASVAESAEASGAYHQVEFQSDANGEFTVVMSRRGLWNVRALHIVPASGDSGSDWDVHWATLVWEIEE